MSPTVKHPLPPSLDEVRRQRKPIRNVNAQHKEKLSRMNRLAIFITDRVGTMGFFSLIFIWTACWLGWNLLAPKPLQFDPPMGFVVWLFISNLIQLFLMPLIMLGQNIQGHHAELRAENDYHVNLKAEREIEVVLQHLEYQNDLLLSLAKKLDLDIKEVALAQEADKPSTARPKLKPTPNPTAEGAPSS